MLLNIQEGAAMSGISTEGCSAATEVTMSDIRELQQQIKHLMELIQKLATEFRAVKAELEESRVDVDSIHKTLKDVLQLNI